MESVSACSFRPKINSYEVATPEEETCKSELSKEYRKLRNTGASAHKTEQLYNYAQKAKSKKDEINSRKEED